MSYALPGRSRVSKARLPEIIQFKQSLVKNGVSEKDAAVLAGEFQQLIDRINHFDHRSKTRSWQNVVIYNLAELITKVGVQCMGMDRSDPFLIALQFIRLHEITENKLIRKDIELESVNVNHKLTPATSRALARAIKNLKQYKMGNGSYDVQKLIRALNLAQEHFSKEGMNNINEMNVDEGLIYTIMTVFSILYDTSFLATILSSASLYYFRTTNSNPRNNRSVAARFFIPAPEQLIEDNPKNQSPVGARRGGLCRRMRIC